MPLRLRFAASLIALLVGMVGANAPMAWADKFQPISPDELKMTSEPLAPGAAAIILFRQVDRDDSRSGSVHENNYYRIKIFTEEGRKHANVELPFVKGFTGVEHIEARTIKADGTIVEFDGKVFEKSLLKGRGFRVLAKTFTLPAVEPGCVIEYSYVMDMEHAYASHWILSEELFTKSARFSLKPYRGTYSPIVLRRTWQNLPPGAEIKEGADHVLTMEAKDIPAFQTEDYMPPANELKSRVDFDYESEGAARDPDQFWKNVGKRRNDLMEAFAGKKSAMEAAVAQIVQPNDPPETKLRKIYDRVQHLRNLSFELRKTEQEDKREKEKLNENVEDVWKRGYGNKWQLDWLFLALARAAGFEASGCWVSSRAEYFFHPQMMLSGHLNESAVVVKLNGQDVYFNPGAAFAPFGLLNWSETGTSGMRLDKDGGAWITTGLPKPSESAIQRTAKLKLSEAGDLEGKLTVSYTGLEAMYHRISGLHADEVARKKMLEEAVKAQIPVAAEAELTNKPDWDNAETPLIAEYELKVPNWSSSAGKRVVLPAGLFTAREKNLFEHANRIYPIYFEYPYEKTDDVTVELPDGWQVNNLPSEQTQDGHVVKYDLRATNDHGMLHLTRDLTVDFLMLQQKYYAALRTFFQAVRSGDEQQIVLQPGSATASN